MSSVWQRHRGPYTLLAYRPAKPGAKRNIGSTEVVAKNIPSYDVEEEAKLHLTDPRDSILVIFIYSETETQFVSAFRKGGFTT